MALLARQPQPNAPQPNAPQPNAPQSIAPRSIAPARLRATAGVDAGPRGSRQPCETGAMVWLGIDMGGTATRWATVDTTGTVVAHGQVAGATALPDPAARDHFLTVLSAIADAVPDGLRGATLGLTGCGLYPDAALIDLSAAALGLEAGQVTLLNDVVLAWHAVYPAGGGHLVAAGTGSVGLSIGADGAITLVGGRGTLIDDAGSGAWIALRALDALWRLLDQHGAPLGAEGLARHLFAALGGNDWDTTQRYVYAGDRGRIAALAPAVAAAASEGDATAIALMQRAGTELARLAQALVARCGPGPVSVIGGVLGLHPALVTALETALPGVTLSFPSPDTAIHAATLARAHCENEFS